ncbi:MAG: glucokinase [Desulfovibrionaceae bacterium]|nr:glucokinase [Desulfovibrionaceae bacterium]
MRILAADIGGTHSRFGLFESSGGLLRLLCMGQVPSAGPDFTAVLDALALAHPDLAPGRADRAALAVAGPVNEPGRVQPSNLPYVIEAEQLRRRTERPGLPVLLINDFEAQALACLTPVMDKALPLPAGAGAAGEKARFAFPGQGEGSPCLVVGAGTGLGMALLVPDAAAPGLSRPARVWPSEGGHALFPFVENGEDDEPAFGRFVAARRHVAAARGDDILSGPGLALLHEFLTGQALEPARVTALPDFEHSGTCRIFARFYGRLCRNMALITLARSGLVITGGLASRCPALIRHPAFREEFLAAPAQFHDLLRAVPVWHNADPLAGLWGAALAGSRLA